MTDEQTEQPKQWDMTDAELEELTRLQKRRAGLAKLTELMVERAGDWEAESFECWHRIRRARNIPDNLRLKANPKLKKLWLTGEVPGLDAEPDTP